MAGIGDAAPRTYVTDELIRRTIGIHGNKTATSSEVCGIEDLKSWHNTKRPWIRMVSNAVPYEKAKTLPEYKVAQEVYGSDPDENTRFNHVLWGGKGQVNAVKNGVFDVGLANDFDDIYTNPFQLGDNPNPSYRPMPGITAVDVTYAGTLGALKRATISFKCYTLDDLERLEKLYMYPGIRLLVEWGWSINTADEDSDRKNHPISPMELSDEKMKTTAGIYNHIQKTRMESGGCYDGMFGTITNFSWTVNKDLSFDCTTKISDFGDSIFTIPVNTPFKSTINDTDDSLTLISALESAQKYFAKGGVGKNNKITEETIDLPQIGEFKAKIFKIESGTTGKLVGDKSKIARDKQLYIRFGDVVDRLCNRLYALTSKSTRATADTSIAQAIAMFSIGGSATDQDAGLSAADIMTVIDPADKDKALLIPRQPISVVSNHKSLISVDPDICLLPNQIGASGTYTVVDEAKSNHGTSKFVPTGLKGEGCDFNVPIKQAEDIRQGEYARESEYGAGFLSNIFVNFDILVQHAATAGTVNDFLGNITRDINKACGDVWMFQWRMLDEYPGMMTCIDQNFSWTSTIDALELSVDNQSSIVKSLSMQSSISNNMQNALYMAANGPDTGEDVKIGEMQTKTIIPLQIEFELDGISGIQYGTSFAVNYLPQRYRDQAYLFAKQVQHSINSESWTTTVTTIFRWSPIESTLRKIKLNTVVDYLNLSTAAIRASITEDNPVATGITTERVYGNEQFFPPGLFRSAESEDITIGGNSNDASKGMPLTKVKEKATKSEDQIKTLSTGLARTYSIGSNDKDVTKNASILKDILNKLPEPADAGTPASSVGPNTPPKKKRVVIKPTRTDFTKVMGSATYEGGTDVPPPTYTFKGKLFAPPGLNITPPKPTFLNPA